MKKLTLHVLCTELTSIRGVTDAVSRFFEIVWARDARELTRNLSDDPTVSAVVVDNSLVRESAIQILDSIRATRPDANRVLLSDYCDLSIIVDGLNTGVVQRIVYKPIYAPELLAAVAPPALRAAITPNRPPAGKNQPNFRAAC